MSKLFLILLSLLGLTTAGLVFIYPVLALNVNKEDNPTSQAERTITVNDNGWHLVIHTKETDLARILLANNIRLNQLDKIYPDFNQPVFDAIIIERAVEELREQLLAVQLLALRGEYLVLLLESYALALL